MDTPTVAESLACPGCGGEDWRYNVTYSSLLSGLLMERVQSNEEIRCGRCNRKANKSIEILIRLTPRFQEVREKENDCL